MAESWCPICKKIVTLKVKEAIEIFIEECEKMGTLEEVLEELNMSY